ncbi:MAG: hypothetical protein RSA66_10140 [Muribaculaceae bacterium]
MSMAGLLDDNIISDFEKSFRTNCLILIGEAYKWLNDRKIVSVDWSEETISANILTHIEESEKAVILNINISDECRGYNQDILNNKKSAKSAPRIDLKLTTNWSDAKKRVTYFVEAKNLIEIDCIKQGRTSKLNANKIHKRYISTGIDHFVSEYYPANGCMLGYVLEGTPNGIVERLNVLLRNSSRGTEILERVDQDIPYIKDIYSSCHINNYVVNHYFISLV